MIENWLGIRDGFWFSFVSVVLCLIFFFDFEFVTFGYYMYPYSLKILGDVQIVVVVFALFFPGCALFLSSVNEWFACFCPM